MHNDGLYCSHSFSTIYVHYANGGTWSFEVSEGESILVARKFSKLQEVDRVVLGSEVFRMGERFTDINIPLRPAEQMLLMDLLTKHPHTAYGASTGDILDKMK